jgi:hypothetical protein
MSIAVRTGSRTMLRRRARAFRAADAILLGVAGVAFWWGPVALATSWFAGSPTARVHRVHVIGTGVLLTFLLLVPLVAELIHPERKIAALQQYAAGGLAIVVAGALSMSWLAFAGLGFLATAAALWLLHPARAEFAHRIAPVSKSLAVLTIGGAVPLGFYVARMASLQRDTDGNRPVAMAAMATGLVLCAALASARPHGWRLPAACAGIGLAVMGAASIVFSHHAASFGSGWGMGALVGGTVFVLAAEHQHRVDDELND